MTPITAVLDACVLYPAPLRDLLMYLAVGDVYRPRWTDAIHEEWIRNLLESRPDLRRTQLERTRDLMNRHAPRLDGHRVRRAHRVPEVARPRRPACAGRRDPVGSRGHRDVQPLRFPRAALAVHGIEGRHPDAFCCGLLDTSHDAFLEAARLQRLSLKNPPRDVPEFLGTLRTVGLPRTAERLSPLADRL